MIRVILWDIDGTLLDFKAAEKQAMEGCFRHFGLGELTSGQIARYSALNQRYWRMLEAGQITKSRLLVERFEEFFREEGLNPGIAAQFNDHYQILLGETVCFLDNGYDLIARLRGRVGQYAVTNGTQIAQNRKLAKSGLDKLFDGVFISELTGAEKPDPAFFDHVFRHIPPVAREDVLIVGDSLTSDMRGGRSAGIRCCWYNPNGLTPPEDMKPDYVISNLNQVEQLI